MRQNLDHFAAGPRPPSLPCGSRHPRHRRLGPSHPTDALSGGQLSRVSLAAARLGTPALLARDEPAAGPASRRGLWNLLRALTAGRGTTVLVSSPVVDEAERCHRLLLMHEGRILAEGVPRARTGSTTVEEVFLPPVGEAAAKEAAAKEATANEATAEALARQEANR